MQVTLSAEGQAAVDSLLRGGWYTSAEQVVEVAVAQLLEQEPNHARLRVLVQEGIDSLANEPVVTREQFLQFLEERRRQRA